MVKVAVIGDTHGDVAFMGELFAAIEKDRARYTDPTEGVQVCVQVGDFALTLKDAFIQVIKDWLDEGDDRWFYWLDGNHDHHDFIHEMIIASVNGAVASPIPYWHERLCYCPRGSTTMIGNQRCMFIGGAYSVDKASRKEHVSWFFRETITARDIYNALAFPGHPDVMFTHDSPDNPVLDAFLIGNGFKRDYHSAEQRRTLARLVDELKPKILFHGHHHYRYSGVYVSPYNYNTMVEGLGCNHDEAILDENYVYADF